EYLEDLRQVLAAVHGPEAGAGVGGRELLVEDGLDVGRLHRPALRLEHVARSDLQALQLGVVADQGRRVERVAGARHHADDRDVAPDADGPHALLDGAATADLHDEVRTLAAGRLTHRRGPGGRRLVVDQVVGPERLRPL